MGGQLLSKRLPSPGRDNEIAAQITASAHRANDMIHDLLDLARCNLGLGLSIVREKTELASICRAVVKEVQLGHPRVHIIYEGPESISGLFDPKRIAQVFSNLIGNAVRHGDPTQPIVIDLKEEITGVRFQIQNLGDPIPESVLPNLFNPEGRCSSYSDDLPARSQGLGLGLFIASQIVDGHGGRIAVTSDVDSGTRFEVILPTH